MPQLTKEELQIIAASKNDPAFKAIVRFLEASVDELKDQCVEGLVAQETAKEAIAKLKELISKISVSSKAVDNRTPDKFE